MVENTLAIVFSVHGTAWASSAQPPHRSTTTSPSMLTTSEGVEKVFTRLKLWLRTAHAAGRILRYMCRPASSADRS